MNLTEGSPLSLMLLRALEKRFGFLMAIESCLFALVILTALLGNVLVLHAVRRNPGLRTLPNYFVISLCVSDILMTTSVMPWSLGVLISGRWSYGGVSCQVQGFLSSVLAYVSILTISLIAVNRYLKVLHPNTYRRHVSSRSTLAFVVSAWLLSCVGPLAYTLDNNKFVFHPGKFYCTYNIAQTNTIRMVLVYLVYMLIPCVLIVWCYWKVLTVVRRHNSNMARNNNRTPSTSHSTSLPALTQQMNLSEVAESSATEPVVIKTPPRLSVREINVTKSLLAVVLGFSICYLQITIIDTTEKFRGNFSLPREAYVFYTFMGGLASCINPIVYGLTNTAFRKEFSKIFSCQ